jgi:acetyltransferase-like isoleucine patch superfamily enzyme
MFRQILHAVANLNRRACSLFRRWFVVLANSDCHIDRTVTIGRGVEIHVSDGGVLNIGASVTIKPNCIIVVKRGRLDIGPRVFLGWGTVVCANQKVSIGDDCLIAEYVTIRDQNHGTTPGEIPFNQQEMKSKEIAIGKNVWIGAKATILAGASVGANSVVAAHAVVTREVETGVVVGGVPARLMRRLGD